MKAIHKSMICVTVVILMLLTGCKNTNSEIEA